MPDILVAPSEDVDEGSWAVFGKDDKLIFYGPLQRKLPSGARKVLLSPDDYEDLANSGIPFRLEGDAEPN